jgi:hypothetical protein
MNDTNLLRSLGKTYTPWDEARRWRRRFWMLAAVNVALILALAYCTR